MKRVMASQMFILLVMAVLAKAQATATTKSSPSASSGTQAALEAQEKELWEGWKNKNVSVFKNKLGDDSVVVGESGVAGKAETVKVMTDQPCEVKSYSLDNFKLAMLNKNTALLTYTAHSDATCGTQSTPPVAYSSSIYVKRGGKWVPVFHQETAAAKTETPAPQPTT